MITAFTFPISAKKSIQTDTQHGESLQRLQQLEQGRYQRSSIIEDTISQAPVFTQPMRDIHVAENQAAHFEARLIPVGDSKLKVTSSPMSRVYKMPVQSMQSGRPSDII